MELHHYFRFILTSYCAGFVKPDSQIFHLTLDKLDNGRIKPQEVLHVGDTPEIDYLGAVNAGWNAILVHQDAKVTEHYQYVDPEPVFEILNDFQSYVCIKSSAIISVFNMYSADVVLVVMTVQIII